MLMLAEMPAVETLPPGYAEIVPPEGAGGKAGRGLHAAEGPCPFTMQTAKEALRRSPTELQPSDSDLIRKVYAVPTSRRVIASFLEKRRPDWRGPLTRGIIRGEVAPLNLTGRMRLTGVQTITREWSNGQKLRETKHMKQVNKSLCSQRLGGARKVFHHVEHGARCGGKRDISPRFSAGLQQPSLPTRTINLPWVAPVSRLRVIQGVAHGPFVLRARTDARSNA